MALYTISGVYASDVLPGIIGIIYRIVITTGKEGKIMYVYIQSEKGTWTVGLYSPILRPRTNSKL